MSWSLVYSSKAVKQLKKLDKNVAKTITCWLDKNIDSITNPRLYGKALSADKRGLWRYRVGTYRIICQLQNEKLVVLALAIGHRREVYVAR